MRTRHIPIIALLLLAGWPDQANAVERACEGAPVSVTASSNTYLAEVCHAVQDALLFLQRYHLYPTEAFQIELVESPLQGYGHPVYGIYDVESGLVQVMSPDAVAQRIPEARVHNEPYDRDHFAGSVGHEVAHALLHQNRLVERVGRSAHEYLAHATQLAVLPAARRDAIIRAADVGPWQMDDVISDIYMAMAPGRFAVKSYLHLVSLHDPAPFLQRLLSARSHFISVP
jgi:hypothetical protein